MISGLRDPKSKKMYEEAHEAIEEWSKIVYFVTLVLSPISLVSPNAILSFYTYFTTDLGNDAFGLIVPMWCVFNVLRKDWYEITHFNFFWLQFEGFRSTGTTHGDMYWL